MTAVVDPLLVVLADIATERRRQDAKWGGAPCRPGGPAAADTAGQAREFSTIPPLAQL